MTTLNTVSERKYIIEGECLYTPWGEVFTAQPPGDFPEKEGYFYLVVDDNPYPHSFITYIPPGPGQFGWLFLRYYVPEKDTFELDKTVMVEP